MSEAPGDPSVQSAESTAPAPPVTEAPEGAEAAPPREKRDATIRGLVEAGAHFGHQTRRWDPQMKPFIFGRRDGIHIIDLDQTLPLLQEALEFVRETVAEGGKVLFVGTKRQAQASVQIEATRCGQYYVNNRWLGGMLTNFRTVKKSIERFKEQLAILADEEQVSELSKKELSRLNRSVTKYRKSLDGIKEMSRLPDVMFLIDVRKEHIAVSEAQRLGIPVIAIVDTNCSPQGIEFPVPANDDAIRAIQLYCELVADACLEGAELFNERVVTEPKDTAGEAAAPAGGRRVVEIKPPAQQTRRGRQPGGTHSAGARRRDTPPPAAEEAAPAAPTAPAGEKSTDPPTAPAGEKSTDPATAPADEAAKE